MNGCSFNIKTLKPSMTEQVFFSFQVRGILYIKEETFDCKYVGKSTDYIFLVYGLEN